MRLSLILCVLGSVTLASAGTGSAPVTFYKDVLPVLQKNCQTCHRPGEIAPASFLTYDSTRPWAKSIKTAVLTKKMPPWFADAHYGKFANDRSLANADIQTLVSWVDAGALAGDPKDAPKPMEWVEGWRIGKPDAVITMPIEYQVPKSGTIDYQYIVIPTGFTEDKYVQMAEARPGNTKLVHHIIAFVREPGNPWLKDAKPGVPYVPKDPELSPEDQKKQEEAEAKMPGIPFPGDFLVGYAPGTIPQVMKPGQRQADQGRFGLGFADALHSERHSRRRYLQGWAGVFQDASHPACGDNQYRQCYVLHTGWRTRHAGECEDDPAAGCHA